MMQTLVLSNLVFACSVYDDVRVVGLDFGRTGVNYTLRFKPRDAKKINWKESNRFMDGNLLALTCDNFRTTLFATVAKRDEQALAKQLVGVSFDVESRPFIKMYVCGASVAYSRCWHRHLGFDLVRGAPSRSVGAGTPHTSW